MPTSHRARPDENPSPNGASPRGSRGRKSSDEPTSRGGLAARAAALLVGVYLVQLGARGAPLPGGLGADDRAAWAQAGPGAWSAQAVIGLAAGVFAVLVGGIGLLANLPVGGTGAAALRARVRARSDLIMFALAAVIFTVAFVVLAVLWSTGVAYRTYEVESTVSGGALYAILLGVCAIVAGVGWAMVISLVRGPARVLRPGERLPMMRLVLRPFGYLAMGVIWTALWLVILAIVVALPIALSDRRPVGLADVPLGESQGIVDLQSNPLTMILVVLLLCPLLVAIFGWVVALFPLTSWPLAALSFVYVGRSLLPSYAGEALSATSYTDEAIGPVTATGETALSLLPVRSSRFTDVLMKAYLMGWTPSGKAVVSCLPLGVGYLFAIIWFTWPVTSAPLVALFSVISLGLAGYSVYRLVGIARDIPNRTVRTRGSIGKG